MCFVNVCSLIGFFFVVVAIINTRLAMNERAACKFGVLIQWKTFNTEHYPLPFPFEPRQSGLYPSPQQATHTVLVKVTCDHQDINSNSQFPTFILPDSVAVLGLSLASRTPHSLFFSYLIPVPSWSYSQNFPPLPPVLVLESFRAPSLGIFSVYTCSCIVSIHSCTFRYCLRLIVTNSSSS